MDGADQVLTRRVEKLTERADAMEAQVERLEGLIQGLLDDGEPALRSDPQDEQADSRGR